MSILHNYKPLKLITLTVIIVLLSYSGYKYFEKPINTRNIKIEASFTATEFLTLITTNNTQELKKYIEKGIEVKGVIKEINQQQKIYTLILRGTQNNIFVLCEMQQDEVAKVLKLKVGELVTIKGVYKGTLNDAILLYCILV